jgi:hypothetical protein
MIITNHNNNSQPCYQTQIILHTIYPFKKQPENRVKNQNVQYDQAPKIYKVRRIPILELKVQSLIRTTSLKSTSINNTLSTIWLSSKKSNPTKSINSNNWSYNSNNNNCHSNSCNSNSCNNNNLQIIINKVNNPNRNSCWLQVSRVADISQYFSQSWSIFIQIFWIWSRFQMIWSNIIWRDFLIRTGPRTMGSSWCTTKFSLRICLLNKQLMNILLYLGKDFQIKRIGLILDLRICRFIKKRVWDNNKDRRRQENHILQ